MEPEISKRDAFIVQFFTAREMEGKDQVDFLECHGACGKSASKYALPKNRF